MPAQLNFYKEYPGKPLNIPFEESLGPNDRLSGRVLLKFKIRKTLTDTDEIYNKAVDHYITHYFPEFYRNMKDPDFTGDNTHYEGLRTTLKNGISTENPGFATVPPGAYKIFITRLELEQQTVTQLRNKMARLRMLPSFEESLNFFNKKNNISLDITSQSEIQLENVLTEVDLFGAVMKDFSKQKDNYGGAVPLGGINFNFLGKDVTKVITVILREVLKDVEATAGEAYRIQEGDLLTIYFSERKGPMEGDRARPDNPPPDPLNIFNIPKIGIAGITYSAGGTEYLKVGYFSLIKYNKRLRDPLTLKTLQNYKEMLTQAQEHSAAGTQFPMFEFLSETLPDQIKKDRDEGNLFSFPTPNDRDNNDNNALLQEAIRLGLIDVNDTSELEEGIKALTTEELTLLTQSIESNPELAEKVYQEERKKKLETGIDIANTIGRALETGPLAMFEENSAVDRILGQIGLKALAKEALICLTFGINFELGRIADAVGNVLEEELQERPSMDPQQFDLFKIKGDLWKTILDLILNSIQQALIALIKSLTEMLKEACNLNNPRANDHGETDLAGLISDNFLDPLAGQNPFGYGNDQNSPLGDLMNLLGPPPMSPEDIYKYISDLSSILSSLDICILLMDIQSASDELIDRIIEFNLGYGNAAISSKLVDVSSVIEFFTLLGNITDVTDLCNEIINDLSLLNQDNICLDLGQLDAQEMQNIEDLLDIIENGFDDEPPAYNFDCPDAENYISDPTITRLIPETLSMMVELVEMQFIYSADSIKNVLLEPTLARADGRGAKGETAYGTAIKSVEGAEDWPELPKPDPDALNSIMGALKKASEGSDDLRNALEECLIDVPGLLNPDLREAGEALDILMDVLASPEIAGAVSNMTDKVDQLNQGTGPAVTTYRFNQEFYNKFIDYIDIEATDWIQNSSSPSVSTYYIKDHFKCVTAEQTNTSRVMFSFPNIAWAPTMGGDVDATAQSALNCKDQTQIDQILGMGGSVPQGSGCPGTTHGPVPEIGVTEQRIELQYPAYGSDEPVQGSIFKLDDLFTSDTEELFQSDMLLNTPLEPVNYNLDEFVDAASRLASTSGSGWKKVAEQRYFPLAYGLLVDQIFDYYSVNGIFDAATLQSLNFFHDNANCAAGDVSDLLDVSGIFKQMQKEYLEEACNNNPEDARSRMREVIKFGMFLLLVQVHVAEFIMKNIFVFGAVEMDELFAKPFIVSYMRDQVVSSMKSYFTKLVKHGSGEKVNQVKDSLVTIFNRMMERESTVANGGLLDSNNNIVFPYGTVFLKPEGTQKLSVGTPTATFNDIIDYLTISRIQSSMGTVDLPGPASNAVKNALPISRQKPMEEIFLNSMPVVAAPLNLGAARNADSEFLSDAIQRSGIVMVKKIHPVMEERPDCLDQIQIDQILGMGGTVANGRGCPGTTHHDIGEPAAGEHMHEHVGGGDWTIHQNDEDHGDGAHDLSGAYVPHSHYAYTAIGPSVEGSTSAPPTGQQFQTGDGDDLVEPAVPPTPPTISYECWMHVDDLTSFDLYAPGDLASPPNNKMAFQLFKITVNAATDLENYSVAELLKDDKLSASEVRYLLGNETYQNYFTNVFGAEVIGILPIIHNFYLTTRYFKDIRKAMRSTKNRVMDILENTIANHNSYNPAPDLRRPGSRQAALNSNEPDGESLAIDFILKMLVKTPIDILKMIVELLDPHVVISKLIKNGSAEVFNVVQTQLRQIDLPSPDDEGESALAPFAPGATGGDLFIAVLCLLQYMMENPEGFPRPDFNLDGQPDPPPENFFPRISKDGIDFLGTGMGMLMIPPTPFGLIYLLLSLINFDTEQPNLDIGVEFGPDQTNAGDAGGPSEC